MSYYYQNINHYKRIIRRNPLYTEREAIEYVGYDMGHTLSIGRLAKRIRSDLCKENKAEKKITYSGSTIMGIGFKLACSDCLDTFGRDVYSTGCEKIIHEEKIEN